MTVTQQIIAAGALVIAGLLVVTVVSFWKRSQPAQEEAQANTPPPCRINLVAEDNPAWKNEKSIVRYAEQFRALGFQRLSAFRIPELDNQRILALVHPTERFYACVYDTKAEPTFEIWAEFASDNSLMGTNSTWVREIEQRPGSVTLRLSNATPTQVLDMLRQHEKATDRVPLTGDGFVTAFQKAYVRNLNWTLKKGDITRDQIRLEARREGKGLSVDEIEELYRARRTAYVAQLQDACRVQYRDHEKLDAAAWQRLQNRLFAVPLTYELKEVIQVISYAVPAPLNERQLQALQSLETSLGDDGIVFISKFIAKNIGDLGLKQIGEVTEPVRAWIVVAGEPGVVEAPAAEPSEQKVAA